MNQYPFWKNALVVLVAVLSLLVALPNFYGEDPAVQVSHEDEGEVSTALVERVKSVLDEAKLPAKTVGVEEGMLIARFPDTDAQLRAVDVLQARLGEDYTAALNLAPRTPDWLRALGLQPMNLGLDLRGGVHFLLEVDMQAAIQQALERYESDIRALLREQDIRYSGATLEGQRIRVTLREAADLDKAAQALRKEFPRLDISIDDDSAEPVLLAAVTEQRVAEIRSAAIEQNTTTIRSRVNELGVSEPIVQRQGANGIVVQLPGVQDTARAKKIIGATATVEFRLVAKPGEIGAKEYTHRVTGQTVRLSRDIIVTGDQLTDAASAFDQNNQPAVSINLDSQGGRRMLETTRVNVGEPMAVVFIENVPYTVLVDGEAETRFRTVEEVISVATIQGVLSNRFQITGLEPAEARNLALLLRSGSLAAPINIVEERTIGPSLGQDNIEQGVIAVVIGSLLVFIFMTLYYRAFGLIANIGLIFNVVQMIAVMSLLQATLTLPGIAGIVLTIGMAVDANVLIFERMREELRFGSSPQIAINSGYDKALSSILDGNITTLIAALVLFIFGTGPVKGFAVTLSIGILTSMFTAIIGTRAIVNATCGNRRLNTLWI
ncbi:MAG TPA: protein translocase subunit SecD [Gammaproteobacteria bacterium]